MKEKILVFIGNLEQAPFWKFWNPMSGFFGGIIFSIILNVAGWSVVAFFYS